MPGMEDEWTTPGSVFEAIDKAYGPFDLDAAATAANAKCAVFYTIEDDGLCQPWKSRVWVNPPYSETGKWTARAAVEVQAANADVVVMLVPSRTGCGWWRQALRDGAHVVYWPRRIAFGNGDRAPFDNAVLVFGEVPPRVALACRNCNNVFVARRGAKTCSARCRMALSRRTQC